MYLIETTDVSKEIIPKNREFYWMRVSEGNKASLMPLNAAGATFAVLNPTPPLNFPHLKAGLREGNSGFNEETAI